MLYDGPIYFEPVPCSSSRTRKDCPSALASSSRLHPARVGPDPVRAGDFEWKSGDSETRTHSLQANLSAYSNKSGTGSRLDDVQLPHHASSRSFDLLSTSANAWGLPYRNDQDAEMTPAAHSWTERTMSSPRLGKVGELSRHSFITLSSADEPVTSPRLDCKPFSTLTPGKCADDHNRNASPNRTSSVSGVDREKHPLLDHSAPLRSDSLQVPCDVDIDRDLYSPAPLPPSSLNSHPSAEMSAHGPSRSTSLPDQRLPALDSTSFSSDRPTEGCLNNWQPMMDDASSFFASSPCPSSCSSRMGFASTLHKDPIMLGETTYRTLLDEWSESEIWKADDKREEGGTLGFVSDVNYTVDGDKYPRSAASSPQCPDVEMHPAVLPALLNQQDFSTLMLQSFALALADAASEKSDGFELFKAVAEAGMECDARSDVSYPSHIQEFDFMDEWSPPALRASSSASSLDPFHIELFSPASEQVDPAAVWEAHQTPVDSSDSREYFSSSPFLGWSPSSDADSKPPLLTMGGLPVSAAPHTCEVPLYQPQPIRPIPPIDIPVNLMG